MKTIHLKSKIQVDVKSMVGRTPTGIIGDLIDEDVDFILDGKCICSYRIVDQSLLKGMREVSLHSKMAVTKRMNGIPTQSAVYGVMPRSEGRGMEYCRFTVASQENRRFMGIIRDFNGYLCDIYKESHPNAFEKSMEIIKDVHPDWRWMNGPFLTCNFNVNYAIPYHYDAANMRDILSNVLILKHRIAGGELVCPELGVTFSQRDGALILFNGYEIMHGVLPFTTVPGEGPIYRSSIVYYTLTKCRNCLSKPEETMRAKDRYDKHMYKDHSQRLAEKREQLNNLGDKSGTRRSKNRT